MSFETSAVRAILEAYVAGRVTADRVAAAIAEAYYRDGKPESRGTRDALRPLLDLVERASPGRVELSRAEAKPGFELRTSGRTFPKDREPELRATVEQVLQGSGLEGRGPGKASPGWFVRLRTAVRRLLS
jgi:hypothetical protein